MRVIERDSKIEGIRSKFLSIIDSVNERVLEMPEVINGIALAILAGGKLADGRAIGEHLFMIGPPGVAKSYCMDTFMKCVQMSEDDFVDILLHQFSTPDEILGGVDIETFLTKHQMKRDIVGYLPTAYFAVLDEIWKSGVVTTALFKILNERKFRNGKDNVLCNLLTVLCASNEYPSNAMDAPLWDRLLFRFFVKPLSGRDNWKILNDMKRTLWKHEVITIKEIMSAKSGVNKVEIPEEISDCLYDVHVGLAKAGIELSPRRKEKMWEVVRAQAWLNGRDKAIIKDVSSIWPCCWRHDKEIPTVRKLIMKMTNHELDKLITKFDVIFKLREEGDVLVKEYEKTGRVESLGNIDELEEKIGEVKEEFEDMKDKIGKENKGEFLKMLSQIKTWHKELLPLAMKKSNEEA